MFAKFYFFCFFVCFPIICKLFRFCVNFFEKQIAPKKSLVLIDGRVCVVVGVDPETNVLMWEGDDIKAFMVRPFDYKRFTETAEFEQNIDTSVAAKKVSLNEFEVLLSGINFGNDLFVKDAIIQCQRVTLEKQSKIINVCFSYVFYGFFNFFDLIFTKNVCKLFHVLIEFDNRFHFFYLNYLI